MCTCLECSQRTVEEKEKDIKFWEGVIVKTPFRNLGTLAISEQV